MVEEAMVAFEWMMLQQWEDEQLSILLIRICCLMYAIRYQIP